jgi:hypothetical protein
MNYINNKNSMNKKIIKINESQFLRNFANGRLITENRASKNQSLARKMVRSINRNLNDKEFTENVLHDIPNVRKADFHLYPAVVRFVLNAGNSLDANTILELNKYVGIIAPKAKELGLDQNANGMSMNDFFSQFQGDVSQSETDDREASAQYGENNEGNNNGYKIVPIPTFDNANEYSRYTDWCVTQGEEYFLRYTNNGSGIFYFLLKEGFENVPREQGPNCPLDEYGLSMIAVSFRHDGSINTVTCRWNHDKGGNDSVMTPGQLSKLIGADIYGIFNPDNIQSLLPENMEVLDYDLNYGLKLCKNTTTDNLYIFSYDFSDNICFQSKDYVVYQGKTDEGYDICALIGRDGFIYETAEGDEWIDTIENNGLLYVANTDTESEGGGIYNAKTMEKLKDIPIRNLDNYQNILILTVDDGYKQVINKKTNISMFSKNIDKCVYQYGRLVCFRDNQISIINTDTCEDYIWLADIISTIGEGEYKLYLIQDEDGMFVVSEKFGLITQLPIEETFYVTPTKDVPKECVYLIMCQNGGIALNQDKVFFSHVSSNDFKKLNEFTTLTSMDIREIFN